MNSLSLMLYVADVVPAIAATLVLTSSLYFVICAAILGATFLDSSNDVGMVVAGMKKYFCFFAIAFVIGLLIPSQKTIYYILASEVGEDAIKSDAAKKVLTAIEKHVDEYLNEGK